MKKYFHILLEWMGFRDKPVEEKPEVIASEKKPKEVIIRRIDTEVSIETKPETKPKKKE